jgi:hypothetical protein
MILNRIYTTVGSPGSFGGVMALYRAVHASGNTNINMKQVTEYLQSRDDYTVNRSVRKHFKTEHIWVGGINQLHQMDLLSMQGFYKYNKPITFLLTVIDCFSKVGFVRALANKKGPTVTAALKDIYEDIDKPLLIQSDLGSEFISKNMQHYLTENEIEFQVPEGNFHASFVERFNRTFKSIVLNYMHTNDTLQYVDQLPGLVDSYNQRHNRSIGMAPRDVTPENAGQVWRHMFGNPEDPYTYVPKLPRTNMLPVGQHVRIAVNKPRHQKAYEFNFSEEIYQITDVLINTDPVQYKLETLEHEKVVGRFYREELSVVQNYDSSQLFAIEEVLQSEKRNGKLWSKVKFIGWKDPTWVLSSLIEDKVGFKAKRKPLKSKVKKKSKKKT